MIQYVSRKLLDIKKYDDCIENCLQSRIYAFSWYLDIVADHWDVLVLNDYEAVMPLPWKKKFGLKYITQPYFCQQLGIFSIFKIDETTQEHFLKSIPMKFLKITYHLNSDSYQNKNTTEKKNYTLNLDKDYDVIFKNFSRTRKQRVQLGTKEQLILKTTSIHELLAIQKTFYTYQGFSEETILKLAQTILNLGKGTLIGVFKENTLLGGGLFIHTKNSIVYLYSSFTDEGRKYQAASFLINEVIKEHQKSNLILDFEGGNLTSLEVFFKSFGASSENFRKYHQHFLQRF